MYQKKSLWLRYNITKEFPVIFCNESSYDHHFTLRELQKEFGAEFYCLVESTEK